MEETQDGCEYFHSPQTMEIRCPSLHIWPLVVAQHVGVASAILVVIKRTALGLGLYAL